MSACNGGSRLVRFLVNRFDFMIRFLYCKMRFYRLFEYFFPDLYSSNYETLNEYFNIITWWLKEYHFGLEGKSVLEIGPGNSYINAYNFLHAGAREVILVDKYPRQSVSGRQRTYIRNEIEFFKSAHTVDDFTYADEKTGELITGDMTFITGDLRSITLDRKVDFIYSIAVLHHVRELEQYIQKMADLLNPGGMMFHVVDLKDKFYFLGEPFLFYKYSDFIWDRFCTDEAVTYTNRVRYGDYLDLFERNGFDLVWKATWSYHSSQTKIHEKFAGRSDLAIGDAHFLLRKREA